ncbi:RNA polymerase sigma factor [Pseudonocardia sp. HH130630-07]|uniref:RNA polymerase sigma factor n=1 Tax=Pseudonocardia sp. HH130630-07 TaxID=1690815 RepID=UPI0008151946|nr:sigma-70 family RNA polymerase sigma factor [Pseudonocardia sp. HH130630-07]ANY05489.1 siderophore-interacting protein [Pseudonocardia sp. HH130630-07]
MQATHRTPPEGPPPAAPGARRPDDAGRPGAAGPVPLPARRSPAGEAELVARAQDGDVHAFAELAARHQDALFRVAVRVLGHRADAEDALQEALIDAWRRIGTFRGEAAFSTWMYRIVTNRCTALVRRARRTEPLPPEDALVAVSGSPERAAEVDAELTALSGALAELPEEQRTSWVLRELEGLGYAEISQITGATETAVRGRIHRARTALAERMRVWR